MTAIARALAATFIGMLLAFGCSKVDGAVDPDSETHWFERCADDGDCGSLDCICGICTLACSGPTACSGAPAGAACVSTQDVPGCTASAPDRACLSTGATGVDAAADAASYVIDIPPEPPAPDQCFAPPDGWVETKLTAELPNGGLTYPRVSGERLFAVGPDPSGSGDPAVWVFGRDGLRWARQSFYVVEGLSRIDGVYDLSADGNTFALSSITTSVGPTIVIYTDDGTTFREQARIEPFGGQYSALKLELRGDTLLASASSDHMIEIYERSGELWTLSGELPADRPASQQWWLAAFDGTRIIIITAALEDFASGARTAEVWVRGPGGWQQEAAIRDEQPSLGIGFGIGSVDGDTLVLARPEGYVTVHERDALGWQMTARARSSRADSLALSGDSFLLGSDGVHFFGRSAGVWQHVQTFRPGDEGGRDYGREVDLGAGHVAIAAPQDGSWGAGGSAIYMYTQSAGAHVEPTCIVEQVEEGSGTACRRSGSEAAVCSLLPSGPAMVSGTTPYGDLDMPYGWLRLTNGFTHSIGLTFGAHTPARGDARPLLWVAKYYTPGEALVGPHDVTAIVTLCDQSVEVEATLTLTRVGGDESSAWAPIEGSLSITAPGWNVSGSFALEGVCDMGSSI